MKKLYVYLLLCTLSLFSCRNANKDASGIKEASKDGAAIEQLLVGKWRHKSTVVTIEGIGKLEPLEIPEDVTTYEIYQADGVLRRGNETLGYDSIGYALVGDTILVAEGKGVVNELNAESLIYTSFVEKGSVQNIYVRVK